LTKDTYNNGLSQIKLWPVFVSSNVHISVSSSLCIFVLGDQIKGERRRGRVEFKMISFSEHMTELALRIHGNKPSYVKAE